MAKRRSKARQTRDEAREAYLAAAAHLWDEFNSWYDAHPDATFLEMELELRKHRRVLMGETLELDLTARRFGRECSSPAVRTMWPRDEVQRLSGQRGTRLGGGSGDTPGVLLLPRV